jgi:hypothetical protein
VIDLDLLGFGAAVAAGLIAWEQTRQDDRNAAAYSIAAQELASIKSLAPEQADETAWASFVDDAEEAISREHRLWRATTGLAATRH